MNHLPSEKLSEYVYWLALHRIDGVGPAAFLQLLTKYPSVQEIFHSAHSSELRTLNIDPLSIQQILSFNKTGSLRAQAERDLRWLEQHHHKLLIYTDNQYPALLKQIATPPPLLFVKGNPACLSGLQLAMVGSRSATMLGRKTAKSIARQLSNAGLIVTSGLALGIDAECHSGAIEGAMPTIAVLGSGLDRIYPARHRGLAEQILSDNGALISEFPLGTGALPSNFPRRNRIISGLSLGTLVVEARLRSGSLITAKYALEQNREVFAVPGSIHNPGSRGCHALIRQGAKLFEGIDDVFEELTGLGEFQFEELKSQTVKPQAENYSKEETAILKMLSQGTMHLDSLVENTGIAVSRLMSILVELEIRGIIRPNSGGYTLIPASLR